MCSRPLKALAGVKSVSVRKGQGSLACREVKALDRYSPTGCHCKVLHLPPGSFVGQEQGSLGEQAKN